MRLTELHIENYRSIRSLSLTGLGEYVVLYGPNGAGKSNILSAVQLFWKCVGARTAQGPWAGILEPRDPRLATEPVRIRGVFSDGLFHADLSWTLTPGEARLTEARVLGEPVSPAAVFQSWPLAGEHLLEIPALRGPGLRALPTYAPERPTERAVFYALHACFEDAMFVAQTSPDPALFDRMEALRALLSGEPLRRPSFRAFEWTPGGKKGVQEMVKENGATRAVALDRAGLGVAQLYAILAAIVLSGAPIVTLEEPEAHLYERGSARDLAALLKRLVPSPVNQLFIATHSAQFALDPAGLWSVMYDAPSGTSAVRIADPTELHRAHVVEPGAARQALASALRRGEPNRVVAHRPNGAAVLASEMIELLDTADDVALAFLDTVTDMAVRLVAREAAAS